MKKLCLAIAVGTAFAGAAQAQTAVETYGRLYPYYLSETNGSARTNSMQTGNSNIGFRGNRNLGDGFKAGGQLEAGAYFDEGKDSTFAFDRNSFVYLETPYGEVRLGSFDTVFKEFGDELGILGVSSGTPMSSSGVLRKAAPKELGSASTFHLRQKNSFMYSTPQVSGFTAKIQYSGSLNSGAESCTYSTGATTVTVPAGATTVTIPSQTVTATCAAPEGTLDNQSKAVNRPALVSYGVSYESGPIRVTVASESHLDYFAITGGTSSVDKADEIAISWKINDQHKIAYDYNQKQYLSEGIATGKMNTYRNSASMISIASRWNEKFATAAHYVSASAGSCSYVGGSACSTTGYNGSKVSIGAAYYFDKGTNVFVVFNNVDNGTRARYSNLGSSLKVQDGKDIQNIVAGINYSF
jgi:predicted porin